MSAPEEMIDELFEKYINKDESSRRKLASFAAAYCRDSARNMKLGISKSHRKQLVRISKLLEKFSEEQPAPSSDVLMKGTA